jgi:hypothetical protein
MAIRYSKTHYEYILMNYFIGIFNLVFSDIFRTLALTYITTINLFVINI